jgi:glycosyltransferase involved in cell wall biosynthesis
MSYSPRKICINALFLQPHLGGIGNYCYRLLERFLELRPQDEFTLLIPTHAEANFRPLGPRLKIYVIPLRSRLARQFYIHFAFPFRTGRFDLIHSVGNLGLVFCRTPQVITLHDVYERVSPERFGLAKRLLMSAQISASGRMAKAILTGSENSRNDIRRFYSHLDGKLTVVPYGCKFPIESGKRYGERSGFFFVGTLEPGKNLPLALRAFARYRKNRAGQSQERLHIAGAEGWNQSYIPAMIAELGIVDAVDFLGFVPDSRLKEIMGASRALLQPSSYEGFGLPVIEAMACACPAITARNSGLIEAGGDAALFFTTGDEEGLLGRMQEITDDPELGEACLRKGFAHAARFTWDKAAAATLETYDRVLIGRGP